MVLYAAVFTFLQVQPVPLEVHAAEVVLVAVCLFPIAKWYAGGSIGAPMFELVCIAYALQFGNPLYLQPNGILIHNAVIPLPWDGVLRALIYSTAGVSAMIAGYYAIRRSLAGRSIPRVDLPMQAAGRNQYILGAAFLGSLTMLLQAVSGLPVSGGLEAILRLLASQFNIAIILLAYQVYTAPAERREMRVPLYILLGVAVLLGLVNGLLENALIPLILIFVIQWHVTRRLPWRFLIIGVLLFAVLNPVKAEYRSKTWFDPNASTGITDRLAIWYDLSSQMLQDISEGNALEGAATVFRQSMSRFDLLHKFTYVQELTPSVVPYYGGSTYDYFLYAWIPRFVWPDKPSASEANNTVDVDYGFLYDFQTSTANIGIGHLPEAYANFGVPGIIVIMLLEGVLFGVLGQVLNGPQSEGGRAIYLSIMVYFLNGIGSSTVIIFGSLVQIAVVSVLLLRPFAIGFRLKPEVGKPVTLPNLARHQIARVEEQPATQS